LAVASDAGSGDAHAFELPRVELGITGSSSGGSLALTVRGAKIDVAVSGGTPAATAASLIAAAVNAAPISAVIGAPARAVPAPGGAGARVVLHQVREGELEIGSDTTGLSAFVVTDCNDGEDDDLDGIVDLADIGCADATDLSENSPLYPCDDGIDDDGDGSWDTRRFALGDPSCFWLVGDETSECQDGVDNDGEPGTDFDAGVSVRGAANADPNGPDPECGSAIWDDESTGCGLGFELVALAPLLRQLSRRRRRRGVKGGF
jgi:hypothetical protein